jgi:4-aminobutyrate aminotransferase-like enzyme
MEPLMRVKPPEPGARAILGRDAGVNRAFEAGPALLPAGEPVIRFCPPRTIGKEDIETGLEILDRLMEGVRAT